MHDSSPHCTDWGTWQSRCLCRYLGPARSVDAPRAVVIAGPPRVGKSAVVEHLCREFAAHGRCVPVDTRELTLLHPGYPLPTGSAASDVSISVADQIGQCADLILRAACEARHHVVVELHENTPAAIARVLEILHGYEYPSELIHIANDGTVIVPSDKPAPTASSGHRTVQLASGKKFKLGHFAKGPATPPAPSTASTPPATASAQGSQVAAGSGVPHIADEHVVIPHTPKPTIDRDSPSALPMPHVAPSTDDGRHAQAAESAVRRRRQWQQKLRERAGLNLEE